MQGYCVERADFRIFKLERERDARIAGPFFTESLQAAADGRGSVDEPDWVEVKIRIHRSVVDSVIERFGESHVLERGGG